MPSKASRKSTSAPFVALPDTDTIERQLKSQTTQPSFALVFHTRGYNQGQLSALTAHQIAVTGQGKAQLMPGHPLGPKDELAILKLLRPSVRAGFRVLPDTLLYADETTTIWWEPSRRGPMLMLDQNGKVVTRNVVWPNLVMMAQGQRLFVAAVAGDTRPQEKTPLFFSPTGNVWANTEVCTGDATLPTQQGIDAISGWRSVFRDTAFSHDNNHGRSIAKSKKGEAKRSSDPMEFWRGTKHARFPEAALVRTGFTLSDWIDYVGAVERR